MKSILFTMITILLFVLVSDIALAGHSGDSKEITTVSDCAKAGDVGALASCSISCKQNSCSKSCPAGYGAACYCQYDQAVCRCIKNDVAVDKFGKIEELE